MTLMLDPEPTVAATEVEDATQSIHAWSQEDAVTEVVDYHPRSWKLPITLAAAAIVGMIGAATYLEWPKPSVAAQTHPTTITSAPKPQVAPKAETQDQHFITLFTSRGGLVEPGREQMVINEAHQLCTQLTSENENQVIADILKGTPGMTRYTAELFTDAVIDVYCPGTK